MTILPSTKMDLADFNMILMGGNEVMRYKIIYRKVHFALISLLLSLLFSLNGSSQHNNEWLCYTTGSSVYTLEIENNYIWAGTCGGLVRIDAQTDETISFNSSNSGLSDNYINAITIDKSGYKWLATNDGLVKYDGKNWTTYNDDTSDLPEDCIIALTIDDDNIWIGSHSTG